MKNADLSIVYGILALLSVLLFITDLVFDHRRNRLFLALFGCVVAANGGCFLMAVCNSLTVAKLANGLSYFGGAFSILVMLLIYGMLCDYGIIQPGGSLVSVQMLTRLNTRQVNPGQLPPNMEEMFRHFAEKAKTLSTAERRILNYYIAGHEISEIPDLVFVSINTVKKHNRSIYQKLEISSKDELMLYIELFRCCNRLDELAGESAGEIPSQID